MPSDMDGIINIQKLIFSTVRFFLLRFHTLYNADFTVVCYDDIPKDFLREIEEKKETDFKLTCISDGWLYIARGYGKQNTGGYSIAVKEVSVSDNAVYFDSELIGPKQGEAANKLATYPYVVVKIEDAGRSVVFR